MVARNELVRIGEPLESGKISRPENPLLTPLDGSASHVDRFRAITNAFSSAYGGAQISRPRFDMFGEQKNGRRPEEFSVVRIPYETLTLSKFESLRNHLKNLSQSSWLMEDGDFPRPRQIAAESSFSGHNPGYYFPDSHRRRILGGRKEVGGGTLEIHHLSDHPAEAEVAYDTVVASLIISGALDMSTPEKVQESIPIRQKVFIELYHTMLAEMLPPVTRDELYGLEEQMEDVETHLYGPLKTKQGKPMNTLLAGAPGVGKSVTGRLFAFDKGVLTIPASVKNIDAEVFFDHHLLPNISRIKNALNLPTVLLLDDVEILLEAGISVDENGKMSQFIDPKKRARALSLLERLQDTHEVFLLCTLNHPDVDSAFLRRFNPVYFPLPSADQRKHAIAGFISQGPLGEVEHRDLVEALAAQTDGFNYSGLALIPDYMANFKLRNDGVGSAEAYRALIGNGLLKARQRTNLQGLAEFDRAADKMVHSSSDQ